MDVIKVEKGKIGLDNQAKLSGYNNGLEMAVHYYGSNENVAWNNISQWYFVSGVDFEEIEESDIRSRSKDTVISVEGLQQRWYPTVCTLLHTEEGIFIETKEL